MFAFNYSIKYNDILQYRNELVPLSFAKKFIKTFYMDSENADYGIIENYIKIYPSQSFRFSKEVSYWIITNVKHINLTEKLHRNIKS